MEILFVVILVGLIILQFIMVAKFFQMSANIKEILMEIKGEIPNGMLKDRVETEVCVGNTGKAVETLKREKRKFEKIIEIQQGIPGVNLDFEKKQIEYINNKLIELDK